MQTFVLIHGAWHGSWCWDEVRQRLEASGATVYAPTLAGLGERADLMSSEITLQTWIDEVERMMVERAVTDAIVVGHSFAGSVVSGLAEAVPGRIDRLVYLDAMVLEGGETVFSTLDPSIVEERRTRSQESSGGLSMPAPPAAAFGIRDPQQARAVDPRLTPHPFSTYKSPLALQRPPGAGFACTYIACTDPPYIPLAPSRERAKGLRLGLPGGRLRARHDGHRPRRNGGAAPGNRARMSEPASPRGPHLQGGARPTRRRLLAGAPASFGVAAILRATGLGSLAAATAAGAAQGSDNAAERAMDTLGDRIDQAYQSGVLPDLHAVLVQRRGETVAERYFTGEDNAWGRDLGTVTFSATTLHDLRSVTKSIVSLLYAIALERGEVPGPETPLLASFPQYADLADDPHRAAWTVGHALNMTLGTEWNEDLPYTDPANSEIAMETAPDRWRFILERPIDAPAGTVWRYNGGASALIGHIIERGSGLDLPDFAERHLFGPLQIGTSEWARGRDGVPSAASGLRLTAPDLAKIGELILRGGEWNGTALVPAVWIDALATPVAQTPFGLGYCRQWYTSQQPLARSGEMVPMLSGMGNGGQRLFVLPSLEMVGVLYCGRYSQPDQWLNPLIVLQRLMLAEV